MIAPIFFEHLTPDCNPKPMALSGRKPTKMITSTCKCFEIKNIKPYPSRDNCWVIFLTFKCLQIFFSESEVQNWKKKLSVGMWIITSTWKEKKRITNEEQRHFGDVKNRPHLEIGRFWEKNVEKKLKILHAGVILEKKIENFTCSGFNRPFSKTTFFHQYIRGIT